MAGSRRKAYTEAFADVRRVVNSVDPIGLLATGAPDDEYDTEVTDLIRLVMRSEAFGERDVDAIWRRWFGDDYARQDRDRSLSEETRELRRLQAKYAPAQ